MKLSTGLLALSAVIPLTTASTVRNWHAQPTNAAAPRNAVTYQDAVPPLMQELSNPQDRPLVRWGGDGPERRTYRRGGSSLYSDMHQHKQRRGRDYGGRDGRYDWWDNDSYKYGGGYGGGYGTAPHTYRRPVQGSSRETWYTQDPYTEGMEVNLQTEGRPLNADVEVWQGPSNTRSRLKVYSEDGYMRPFRATMDTPRTLGGSAVSVRNAGPMEFPMAAGVSSYSTRNNGYGSSSSTTMPRRRSSSTRERRYYDAGEFTETGGTTIQGGSLQTFQCDPSIGSARVTLHTDGMPLQAVIELWQGPGAARQIAEIDTEDGRARPFSAVIDTPSFGGAYGSVIAIRNTGPLAFPLKASVTPLSQANWY